MKLVQIKNLNNYPDKRFLYAIKFNNDDKRVINHFDAFADLIARLRFKEFDINSGEWIITQNGYEAFEQLDKEIFHRETKPIMSIKATEKIISDYENIGRSLKLPLYEYQKQLVKFSVDAKSALIVAPCGSGKTPVGLAAYLESVERGIISGCGLIIVKASLKTQWFMEVKKFTNLRSKIIQTYATFKGDDADKNFHEQFENVDLLILNYETLRDKEVKKILHKIKPQYIFADECHYIKNYNSKRAMALYEFNDAKIKIGATATPVQRDPRDIFGLFQFINPEIFPSLTAFNVNFVRFVSRGIVGGVKNSELLNKKISPFMIIKNKFEVAKQLPKLVVTQRYCDLDSKQLEMTETLKSELEELGRKKLHLEKTLNEKLLATNEEYQKISADILARQSFAQELADSEKLLLNSDSFSAKKYVTKSKTDNKLDMLMDLIEEVVESGEKITVFSRFAKMQEIIIEKIQNLSKKNPAFNFKIARVFGAMNEKERYDEIYTKFQDGNKYKLLLMSDAGAEGFNLSKCKYICEYEPATSYAIQTQRHGRIERADSIFDTVFVYQLIANGSWDEIAQKIVAKKENYDYTIIRGENL